MANAKGAGAKKMVSIPAAGGEAGLNRYLTEIKKFPILAPEEEYMLATQWREHGEKLISILPAEVVVLDRENK